MGNAPIQSCLFALASDMPVGDVVLGVVALLVVIFIVLFLTKSFSIIGPSEVGLVTKRFGKKLQGDQLIAFAGEAGYQAELLMPGLRFKFWPIYSVSTYA